VILQFSQRGNEFLLEEAVLDVNVSNQSTVALDRTLTVPDGVQVEALIRVRGSNASGWNMVIQPNGVNDTTPSATAAPLADLAGTAGTADRATLRLRASTAGTIRTISTQSGTELQIATYGWVDYRGKQ
jgi:hypothetical protein